MEQEVSEICVDMGCTFKRKGQDMKGLMEKLHFEKTHSKREKVSDVNV